MENKQITTAAKPVWTALIAQPIEYYNNLPAVSVKEILTNSHPPIGAIKLNVKNGTELVKALLVKEIESLCSFFNVTSMNVQQRVETINLACEKLNHWKLDDFKMCFKNAKTGQYGKIFNRLDGGVIFEWFRAYDAERMAQSESLNKADMPTKPNQEGQKKVIEILSEFVDKEKPYNKKVGRVKTEYDVVCREALTEFDRIYKAGKETNGKRYIKVNGKMLDQVEFMDYKIKEYIKSKKNQA